MMTALKSLSDNSNSCTRPTLASVDSIFSHKLRFSSFVVWGVIFNCTLEILAILFWDSEFHLNLLFSRPPMMLHKWGREALSCCYYQLELRIQVPHGAPTDTVVVGSPLTLKDGESPGSPPHLLWCQPINEKGGALLLLSSGGSVGAPSGLHW